MRGGASTTFTGIDALSPAPRQKSATASTPPPPSPPPSSHHHARIPLFEIRRFVLPCLERPRLGRLISSPKDAVRRARLFHQRISRAALFQVRGNAPHPVRAMYFRFYWRGGTNHLTPGIDLHRRASGKKEEARDRDDHQNDKRNESFHALIILSPEF